MDERPANSTWQPSLLPGQGAKSVAKQVELFELPEPLPRVRPVDPDQLGLFEEGDEQ